MDGKIFFLVSGKGWEQRRYDDSWWSEGKGAFGPVKGIIRRIPCGERKIFMSAGMSRWIIKTL